MRRFIIRALALGAVLSLGASAYAQSPTSVQQSATDLRACTVANATAAVNNQVTVTLTPPAGQYVYVCGLDFTVSADATAGDVFTNLAFTSTNFNSWQYAFSANTTTANQNVIDKTITFANQAKSPTSGSVVTFVSPAAKTHAKYNLNVYYYFAQ